MTFTGGRDRGGLNGLGWPGRVLLAHGLLLGAGWFAVLFVMGAWPSLTESAARHLSAALPVGHLYGYGVILVVSPTLWLALTAAGAVEVALAGSVRGGNVIARRVVAMIWALIAAGAAWLASIGAPGTLVLLLVSVLHVAGAVSLMRIRHENVDLHLA